jgi:hypothetical protein
MPQARVRFPPIADIRVLLRTCNRWERRDTQPRQMKALQGWRAFIGEVGVIVLGVLIALVAQQLVEEDLHSRSEVAGFRNVLRDELSIDLGTYQYRAKQEACISARLNQLQQLTLGVPGIRFKSAVCGIPVSRTIAPASGMGRAPTCWRPFARVPCRISRRVSTKRQSPARCQRSRQ